MKNLLLVILFLFSVNAFAQTGAQTGAKIDIEGHRGARGLVPENTVPSFIKAVELGADTLELDVVISKDGKTVVSHEPYFSSVISLDPQGKPIAKEKEKEFNIYRMNYSEIKKFDVGSIGNRDFPEQQKMKIHKPLLGEVFKEINEYIRQNKLKPVRFNIEIKSNVEGDGTFHPLPAKFAKIVFEEISKAKMENSVIVQSFDVRALQAMKRIAPKLPLALLVMNKDGIEKNIEKLGFQPNAYSPHFSLIDKEVVKFCRDKNIKIVPWTVNEIADLERMKTFDLDGIITDYPNRAVKVFRP